MIWFASLDPANLSLNIDTTSIMSGSRDDLRFIAAIESCIFGQINDFQNNLKLINSESQRKRCIFLSSIIWHEQRHYVDLVLLNYGNYLFRQYANCYINIANILRDVLSRGNTIAFPLSIYSDNIRRIQLGQQKLSEPILTLIEDLRVREKAIAIDRMPIGNGATELGGYAQLEALGYIFQIAAIENITPNYSQVLAKQLSLSDPHGTKYSWALKFQELLKFPMLKSNSESDVQIYRVGFLPMLLYATLSTRSWNGDISDTKGHKSKNAFLLPVERLNIILEYLSKRPSIFSPFNFERVWTTVNEIVKELFDRTIIEEIEVDISFYEKKLVTRAVRNRLDPSIVNILNNHLELRKTLLNLLKTNPALLLHPDIYCKNTLSKVFPIPVLTFPGSIPDELLENSIWKGLNGAIAQNDDGKRTNYYWNAIPKVWNPENRFAFKYVDDFENTIGYITPLAKAILKGRNHRSAIGPEFIIMEEELKLAGLETIYEPEFKFPQNLSLPGQVLYELRNTDKLICDTCLKNINKPEGFIISPWVFRRNERIKELAIQMFGGNNDAAKKFTLDWSTWFICNSCHGMLINMDLIPKPI
jgi:hypothetical protein